MINKRNYTYLGRYKSPLIYHWLLQKWANNKAAKKYGLPKLDGRLLLLDGHLFIYRNDWETIKHQTRQAVKQLNEQYFTAIFKIMDDEIEKMLLVSQKLKKSKSLSIKLFQNYFQAMNQMEYPWFFVLPMNEVLEEIIKEKLSAARLPKHYFQSFSTFKKPTLLMQQKREITVIKKTLLKKKLLNKIKNYSATKALNFLKQQNSDLYQKILNHIKTYKWFGVMHMWGSPFSKEKFFEQLKITSIDKSTKTQEPKLPEELEWLRQQTREISYWRDHVAEICGLASYLAMDKLKKASQKMGLTYSSAIWLSPLEFLNGLRAKPIPSPKILKERKKAFGLVIEKGQIIILTGNKLKQTISSVLDDISKISEITGIIANPGKVFGKVKIVLSPHDIQKVKKGDIMISAETTPDLVPAAHRASALVTDMGGLTSHAAIISREIGLPCIVGTKIATRILKDGDVVEVDAKHGRVKRLS